MGRGSKVCNDGEVGVGVSQTCHATGGPTPGGVLGACDATLGTIFSADCNTAHGMTYSSNPCAGGYGNGWAVSCNGDSVTGVNRGNERYGNCYKPRGSGYCGLSLGIVSSNDNVSFCCRRL